MDEAPRCVIAEDELHISARIAKLAAEAGLQVSGVAADGQEALELIIETRPHIAFIDINMPVMNGLELARNLDALDQPPAIIFVTAYSEHALAAFELSAIDYVVKPIDPERFRQSVKRAKSTVSARQAHHALARLQAATGGGAPEKLVFRSGSKYVTASQSDVYYFSALDDFVEAHLEAGTFLLSLTMDALERALPPGTFYRVHRSHIVNFSHVTSADKHSGARLMLHMANGVDIPVARRRSEKIRDLLDRRAISD